MLGYWLGDPLFAAKHILRLDTPRVYGACLPAWSSFLELGPGSDGPPAGSAPSIGGRGAPRGP